MSGSSSEASRVFACGAVVGAASAAAALYLYQRRQHTTPPPPPPRTQAFQSAHSSSSTSDVGPPRQPAACPPAPPPYSPPGSSSSLPPLPERRRMPRGWSTEPAAAAAAAAASAAAAAFDLSAYMQQKRRVAEAALESSLASPCPETDLIVEAMRYSLMAGGKRVRPMLCFAATEMFGGSVEAAAPTAVGLEMIHTMSLIHDDLPAMDNDDFRRGKPTNHKRYGEDIAILAGDALLCTAFEHVAKHTRGVPAERVLRVLSILSESTGPLGLAGGQAMDLKCEGRPADEVGLRTLEWIHTHKTAALLKAAVAAGAVLAGASDGEVAQCVLYAHKIGLAFQVTDDILDATASSDDLGKTAGKDAAAAKATYPRLLGLERSRQVAQQLVDEAKAALDDFDERAAPLRGLADYIIARKS